MIEIPKELNTAYNPKGVEERIYKLWEKSGFFNPDKLPPISINQRKIPRKSAFTVMMAPPNITGSLHMGHVLENTEVDILVRMKRMQGFKTLWLPGIDHAGIAAQSVVERELRKEGLRRHDLGRDKFVEKMKEWKEKYGTIILDQLKILGISSDWSRARYTMDPEYTKAVEFAFNHYYEKGWIYRGERVINWCIRCATSISDLEINYVPEKTKLYFIKYSIVQNMSPRDISHGETNYIVVATTRPETILGDTAVAVNPKDSRYKNLIGKFVNLPIFPYGGSLEGRQNRKIPIIADSSIDMKFGTGAVKVTPAHDITDFEIAKRHSLPSIAIIDERGQMNKNAGLRYLGMKTAQAREQIIKDLEAAGLIEKTEDYEHNIARCDRCNSVIEPLPSKQWFLKMKELAQSAVWAVKKKEIVIYPKKWEKVLLNRLKNEKDWNISRQLWWGHQIPVWFHEPKCVPQKGREKEIVKCQEYVVSPDEPKCKFCNAKFIQSSDVLDTWFSSALWPFATLGWPLNCVERVSPQRGGPAICKPLRGSDLAEYYPTDFITSAREILNIWIAKMIFSGMEFIGSSPFKTVYIHATILNKEGKRMSKSLGTGVDPIGLIEKYGTDAVRFGLIYQNLGNQDIRFSEEAIFAGKKFCNKIWNATRFVLMAQNGKSEIRNLKFEINTKLTEADKKILKDLGKIIKEVGNGIEKYEFGHALHKLYDFFWHEYADIYIETAKKQMTDEKLSPSGRSPKGRKTSTQNVLWRIHTDLLKLLHPFLPFITEEIWGVFNKKTLLIIENWPH